MTTATHHTTEEILAAVHQKYGFIPNVLQEASQSLAALATYVNGQALIEQSSLSPQQAQVAQLAISVLNGCDYCTSAHAMAGKMLGVAADDLQAVRAGRLPADAALAPVAQAARLLVEKRGWLDAADLKALEDQGIDRPRLYDLVTLVALKTISNYVNHIAHVPLDPQLGGQG